MSGQLRTIKNRIRSVENTKKITHAMEMVAAAKLRRFQDMMVKARPFTAALETLTQRLLQDQLIRQAERKNMRKSAAPDFFHPFFEPREEKHITLVVMSSDTGLCGSYNTELIEKTRRFLRENKKGTSLIGVGKFGITALKRMGYSFQKTFLDIKASRVEETLKELTAELETVFLSRQTDAVYVLYSHFLTLSQYKPTLDKLLPFKAPSAEIAELVQSREIASLRSAELAMTGEGSSKPPRNDVIASAAKQSSSDYIYEPSADKIFEKLVPQYFEAKIRMIFLESFVSEQIARMNAMHQATENAKEMIDSLVLVRNKARQASITKEIIEIVSGAQAQKIK